MKLAIVTTHPIQYYAPLFRLLAANRVIDIKVFYTWEKGAESFDEGFGKTFSWDIPLLDGYAYEFVSNNGDMRKDFLHVKNPGLEKAIVNWGASAILVVGWNYRSHLRAMRYFSGRMPVLFRGDSTLLDERPGMKQILRRSWLSWVYRNVDIALYAGINNKRYYLRHGLAEKQLHFVPHAVENRRFSSQDGLIAEQVARLKQELQLRPGAPTIVYAGKFQEKKDPLLLLQAFIEMQAPHAELVFVGNGQQENTLKNAAAGHANVHFVPFQNQSMMPAVYHLADLFCLPSRGPNETWGLAVNEAMAAGRAVLVSDKVGCAEDLVIPGRNGQVFRAGDAQDLRSKLQGMMDAPLLNDMGKESAAIIAGWDVSKAAEAIEAACLGLKTGRKKLSMEKDIV